MVRTMTIFLIALNATDILIPLACCGSLLYVSNYITAWVCDICQVAAFGTLDEAERHEESCDNTHIPIGKSTDWESLPTQSTNNQGGNNLSYTQGGDTEQGSNAYSDNSIHGMTILCPSVTKTAVDSKGPSFWDNNINQFSLENSLGERDEGV